jgi:glycosyltransferase involved in cell wall biosynthesis
VVYKTSSFSEDQKVSIIIPAFNEEKNIQKILVMLSEISDLLPSLEIIVIDDGSTDNTVEQVENFSSDIKLLKHNKNVGKGAALVTGFAAASGDVIVVQDADVEYSPFDIPKLVKPILNGDADVVFGSRFNGYPKGMKIGNYLGNRLISLTTRLLYGLPITDVMTGHKVFSQKVIKSMDLSEKGFKIEPEIAAEVFYGRWRFTEIPISYNRRKDGKSKFRFLRDGLTCAWRLLRARLYSETIYTQKNG